MNMRGGAPNLHTLVLRNGQKWTELWITF